jgi:hypothetical protein
MVTYKKREFSIREKREERQSKRIHFERHRNPKKMVKPFWWSLLLLIIVIGLLLYLSRFR